MKRCIRPGGPGTITATVCLLERSIVSREPPNGEEKQQSQKGKEGGHKSRSQGGEESREEGLKARRQSKKQKTATF
jgi:hypothetical protein